MEAEGENVVLNLTVRIFSFISIDDGTERFYTYNANIIAKSVVNSSSPRKVIPPATASQHPDGHLSGTLQTSFHISTLLHLIGYLDATNLPRHPTLNASIHIQRGNSTSLVRECRGSREQIVLGAFLSFR